MQLLFLAHRFPWPPNKGDKIRAYHQLRALAQAGHAVNLLAFADTVSDTRIGELSSLCVSAETIVLNRSRASVRALLGLTGKASLSSRYFDSAAMHRAVRRTLATRACEGVVAVSSSMTQYVPRRLVDSTLVDLVDVDSAKWAEYSRRAHFPRSWLYGSESHRLRLYEQAILDQFPRVLVTTESEARALRSGRISNDKVKVITQGVDLNYFRPISGTFVSDGRACDGPRLVFTGTMDYWPNVDAVTCFAEHVFPTIKAQAPEATFHIVGRNPAREVRRLARVDGIRVTGEVPDVRPYLASATVFVAPLRMAWGIQNKVLEAMASGLAVIATPRAMAGIAAAHDRHALIVDEPREMANAILRVIHDAPLRARLGHAARCLVEAEHRWGPPMDHFVSMFESVAKRQAAI